MGIKDLEKKYQLNEIISGDTIFCATGITSGDLVSGIKRKSKDILSESLTAKSYKNEKKTKDQDDKNTILDEKNIKDIE